MNSKVINIIIASLLLALGGILLYQQLSGK